LGTARLTPRQAWLWGIILAVIAGLVVCFFLYGRHVRPLLGEV
jgi:hypothetical protein